jgi:hypothetical protein
MRSIGFDTKPLKHFDCSVANAKAIYATAERHQDCKQLLCIANSCRDLMRGTQIYYARDNTAALLSKALKIERGLTK